MVVAVVVAGCTGVRVPAVRTTMTSSFADSGEVQIGVIEDGWSIVEATINGQGPYRLILDTGSDLSILKPELLGVIQPQAYTRGELGDIHGLIATHDVFLAESIVIEGIELGDAPLIFTSTLDPAFKQIDVDGVLGYRGLDQYTLDLDGDTDVVRLSTRRLAPDEPGVLKMVARDGGTPVVQLSHRLENGRTLTKRYGLDSGGGFHVSIAGATLDRFVHTDRARVIGASAALNTAFRQAQYAPLNGSIRFGGADADWSSVHTLSGVSVSIDNEFTLIGNQVLSMFRVQIDPVSRLVRFSRGDSVGGRIRGRTMYGTGILDAFRIEDRLIIKRIGDQSPAMHVGLRPGDAVLEIDGEPVDLTNVRDLIGFASAEPRTLRLLVDRGDSGTGMVEVGMEAFFAEGLSERGPDLDLPALRLEGGTFIPEP